MHLCLGVTATKCHEPGGLNNGNVLSLNSGGKKSEIQVFVVLVPCKSHEERTYSRPLS